MKIAIEALGIHYPGGGRTATMNLLEPLFAIDSTNQYQVFLTQIEPSLFSKHANIKQTVIPIKNRFLVRFWAQLSLPFQTRGYDLVHFVKNLGVFGIPTRTLVTVYDLTTLIHPDIFPKFDVWYWKTIQKHTLNHADKIIAISNNTAKDLVEIYGLPAEKIRVIYCPYAAYFQPAAPVEIQAVARKYGLPENYIIHVGRLDLKKNLTFLVQAYAQFRAQTQANIKLVLVGEPYQKSMDHNLVPTIQQLGIAEDVIFTGRVPNEDLPPLNSGALASIMTSFHEGFGLAPIEAMACGTPVIAYSGGAIQEMAGGAAQLFDQLEISILAEQIRKVALDPAVRLDLRLKGISRAAQFSQEHSARQTLSLYEEIVQS